MSKNKHPLIFLILKLHKMYIYIKFQYSFDTKVGTIPKLYDNAKYKKMP